MKTLISEDYGYAARDLNGSVFVFENKPSLAIDVPCDTWDVKTGKIKQITLPYLLDSNELIDDDWRDSLITLN
ncbi:MAG: hypothetical protein HOK72_02925 [Flavobacteriales bacterium]|nr:hypothetical protein [Flavobacteriales bacterium]